MPTSNRYDAVLIGGGVMSATLATLLVELQPDWSVLVLEKLDTVGSESSDAWNNAGTGHSALCELNYTPAKPDGTVDITKAVAINEQFQLSRQLWAHLVEKGELSDPGHFINSVPHMSFVRGGDVDFLQARFDALSRHPLFAGMEWAQDHRTIEEWAPLLTAGQRVQVIKKAKGGGVLQFGTELVHAADGSIAALLGASPGASTAVEVMFRLLRQCFPAHQDAWRDKLVEMVPSYGRRIGEDADLLAKTVARTNDALHLTA